MDITICIKNLSGLETLAGINSASSLGKSITVTYLLDSVSIGTSSAIVKDFPLIYKVGDLSLGDHSITAKVDGGEGVILTASIKGASLTVEEAPTEIQLQATSTLSDDLFDLITPVLTYKDVNGQHEMMLSKEMYETLTDKDEESGMTRTYFRWNDKIILSLREATKLELKYTEKEDAVFNASKRYFLSNGFSINGYSYMFNNTLRSGGIFGINLNINVLIGELQPSPDDGTFSAEQAEEYVKRLCEVTQETIVTIGKDGKLTINDKTY